MTARRPAPKGLGAGGRALWRKVTTGYELREDEAVSLAAACRLVDELDRLEEELAAAPVMVKGSMGQDKPHPLFAEVRAHRQALGRHLDGLGLSDAEGGNAFAKSHAARKMARARWGARGA